MRVIITTLLMLGVPTVAFADVAGGCGGSGPDYPEDTDVDTDAAEASLGFVAGGVMLLAAARRRRRRHDGASLD